MSNYTAAQLVERGTALLDEKVPGWDKRIRPEALDIADPRCCVVGQLFATYGNSTTQSSFLVGMQELGLLDVGGRYYTEDAGTYGFTGYSTDVCTQHAECLGHYIPYNEMNIEWRRVIYGRRLNPTPTVDEMRDDPSLRELVTA